MRFGDNYNNDICLYIIYVYILNVYRYCDECKLGTYHKNFTDIKRPRRGEA